jgi:hypothetical protein
LVDTVSGESHFDRGCDWKVLESFVFMHSFFSWLLQIEGKNVWIGEHGTETETPSKGELE